MKRFFLFTIAICWLTPGFAQYITSGKIEYERKVNVYAQFDEMKSDDGDNSWFENVKSQIPKFDISYFDLIFDTARTIYKPGREVENKVKMFWMQGPASSNTVLTSFNGGNVTASKTVYEQTFLQHDSLRKIQWKLEDEIRTIADYKCRKAVGKICDSVYVVAFYTDDIMVSGGPEMFSGLPGMILELAVPRLHATWVATKVEFTPPQENDFTIPEKGKKVTTKELMETVQSSFKSWGKWAPRNIWWITL